MGRTSLDDEQYQTALQHVRAFLLRGHKITNAKFRALTGLNYDQAIRFFKLAVSNGVLERRGSGSATHYVLRRGHDS